MPAEERMLDYYGRRVLEYERVYQKPERQEDLLVLREIIPAYLAGADVLELACGTGYWTEVIAGVARSVLATDYGADVLDFARAKRHPESRVRFAVANAFDLAGLDGRFTAGFAGFWWSHVRKHELAGFLRGFHARLEPGARVVFVDNRFVEGSSTPISRRDRSGDTFQLRRLDDGSTHEVLKNFPTRAEIEATLDGLAEEVEVVELPHYWCLSYRSLG